MGDIMSPGVITSKEIILQTDYFLLSDRAEGVRLTETFEDGAPQTPEVTAIFSPSRGERSSMYSSTILVLKDAELLGNQAELYELLVLNFPPVIHVIKTRIDVNLFGPLVLVQLQQDYIEEDHDAKPSNISTDIYVVFKDVSHRNVSGITIMTW